MTTNLTTQSWQSGDWKKHPNSQSPYNGVEVTGTPTYDNDGQFVSVKLTLTDFTFNKDGVSTIIPELTLASGWKDIPIPATQASPPKPDSDFSIKGEVSLAQSARNICVWVRFDYGMEFSERDERGYIMCFPSVMKGA